MNNNFGKLYKLHGEWRGTGFAQYPTIKSSEYEELLKFNFDKDYQIIHFEQKVKLIPENKTSHWETGFIKPIDDGTIELINAQNNGRSEILKGKINFELLENDILEIEFNSFAFANDPRIIKTQRIITVKNNELNYIKFMATTTEKPQMLKHLEANLKKVE